MLTSDCNRIILNLFGLKVSISKSKIWDDRPGPYGLHDLIREYAGVRHWLAGVVAQHGWSPVDEAGANDIRNAKRLMLCLSRRARDNFSQKSAVRCEIAGAPFVHYRRYKQIEIAPDAKGTVAFPAHSVPGLYAEFDHAAYCVKLRALPEQFQPVTICLHHSDIATFHLDKKYAALGFPVVSAPLDGEQPFCEAFYKILRKHRYATSNEPGSYSFYAVEMGIPFFLLGEAAARDNSVTGNIDVPQRVYRIADFTSGQVAARMFSSGERGRISPEVKAYVDAELGLDDCLSAEELRRVFMEVAAAQYYRPSPIRQVLLALSYAIRYPFSANRIPRFFAAVWRFGRQAGR